MNKYSTPCHEHTGRAVKLDHHDSVRSHVQQHIRSEVEQLVRRIEILRLSNAPHAAIMISSYERMIDRKKGFLQRWDMTGGALIDDLRQI